MKGAPAFSPDENACIQNLLNLVSHGNAIIAEILRLKDNIPSVFSLETKEEQSKYGDIVFDFSYLKNTDALEKKIASNPNLQELDDEFKETNLPMITRFYSAFESIYKYAIDLNLILQQLSEGTYFQQTLETLLHDNEGKQLLCEGLYLYGAMLLVCETYLPGQIRERLLVAQHRAAASHHQTHLDRVCELLRDTGYRNPPTGRRPQHYPEELFSRVAINEMFIETVIGRLRSEDIYNQLSIYTLPEHRSTALATQASMLVVCLFFSPNTLISESAKMREIVDKYFPDNWIVSIYMGITISLVDVWEPYKAAKLALANTINSKNIKEHSQKHASQMERLLPQTAKLLQEGALKEESLMDNANKTLGLIKECNITLRWLMLHTNCTVVQYDNLKKIRQVREQTIADSKCQAMDLFQFLINTSLLELCVKDMLKKLLNNKELTWEKQKKDANDIIIELSEAFSGQKPLPKVEKNVNLSKWFIAISGQINSLKHDDMTASSNKIIQLIQALEVVQEFHRLDDIMQVKQWLNETRSGLKDMVRGGGLTEDSLVTLQVCSDLSYGWYLAQSFTALGRDALKKDPALVSHLRAVFLKLASALEIPLLRINQAGSEDLLSVSQYYSNELVSYVREVLQIIPETVFSLLERIIELQTSVIMELPTRLDKDKLKEFAQLDERMEVAKLTHSVSVFTSGILKMRSTLVGVICIDPKQLLEDGIRREVCRLVEARLTGALITNSTPGGDLPSRLQKLAQHMDGYRRSFEYIQDYINIHGLKIWQEEVSKIITNAIEVECNRILKLKPMQNSCLNNPADRKNMFGCLAQDIYALADPKSTIYIEHNSAWYDSKSNKETMTMLLMGSIQRAVGPAGVYGVSRILGFRVSVRLKHLTKSLSTLLQPPHTKPSFPAPHIPIPNSSKTYNQLTAKMAKSVPLILEWILEVGAAQLLMKHLAYQINTSCKFDSYHLEASLTAINEAIINDIKINYTDSSKPYPHKEFLFNLNGLLERSGISNPYTTVYIKAKNDNAAYIVFLIVLSFFPRLVYYENLGCLSGRRQTDQIDGAPFIVGVVTLLRQYHPDSLKQFILYICQYIISYAENGLSLKNPELFPEATIALRFLEIFCKITKTPQSFIESVVPVNILNQHQFMINKTI